MDGETEWTLKALVDQLGLPTTTVFRQVATLTERRYLEQDPVRKSYRPGPRLLMLASAILGQSDLRRTARPELERLSDILQETINLSVLLEHDIFYLDKVETHRSIVCNTQVGSRAPAYATSGGKVMLACQSEAYIDDYCRWMESSAVPLTVGTIVDPEQLRRELSFARIHGYALDDGEIEEGLDLRGGPHLRYEPPGGGGGERLRPGLPDAGRSGDDDPGGVPDGAEYLPPAGLPGLTDRFRGSSPVWERSM